MQTMLHHLLCGEQSGRVRAWAASTLRLTPPIDHRCGSALGAGVEGRLASLRNFHKQLEFWQDFVSGRWLLVVSLAWLPCFHEYRLAVQSPMFMRGPPSLQHGEQGSDRGYMAFSSGLSFETWSQMVEHLRELLSEQELRSRLSHC